MSKDSKILLNYTVTPTNESNITNPTVDPGDTWKSSGPLNQSEDFIGFKEVGIVAARTKFLQYYDELIQRWLNSFEILSSDEKTIIPVTNIVYGTPERLFATNPETGVGNLTERVTLPAISFHRTTMDKVYNRGATLRSTKKDVVYTELGYKNLVEIKSTYHLIDITYQIDLWTKYQSELQMLQEQALLPFGPQAYFRLFVPEFHFDDVIMMKWGGMSDSSTLEEQTSERTLRSTVTVMLQAYVPIDVSKIEKTIKTISLEEAEIKYLDSDTPGRLSLQEQNIQEYTQETSSLVWNIIHDMNKYPTVAVVDSNNNLLTDPTDYTKKYVNNRELTLTFNTSTSGKAYLT